MPIGVLSSYLLSRWFKECFSVFCVSYVEIQMNDIKKRT